MIETALQHIPTKSDKRKTAKYVTPLRFLEDSFLSYRDLISTFKVEIPHKLIRFFLTGYMSILGVVYLQAKKSPHTSKSEVRGQSRHDKLTHRNIVFLFGGLFIPIY